jgi:hypothetical protein
MKQAIIECPMRDRQPHTTRKPERLDVIAVKHIEHQIARNNYPPLPRTVRRFHRCLDCCAVWVTGSAYEMATDANICGIYDETLIWKPR